MAPQTHPAATQDATAGWWPSRYGADDQAGALNEITPGKVLEDLRLADVPRDRLGEFLLVISRAKLRGSHRCLGGAAGDRVKGAS